jgi:hypothetical protein
VEQAHLVKVIMVVMDMMERHFVEAAAGVHLL